MDRELVVLGRDLPEDKKQGAREYITQLRREQIKKVEGESPKTPWERACIRVTNSILQKDFPSVVSHPLPVWRYHMFSNELYEGRFSKTSFGIYQPLIGEVFINRDSHIVNQEVARGKLFHTIFYQAIEAASYQSFYVVVPQNPSANKEIAKYRVGYGVTHPLEKDHEHFRGFKRAVIDRMVVYSAQKHSDTLWKKLRIESSQQFGDNYLEQTDQLLLNLIVKTLSEERGVPEDLVWNQIVQGTFTGGMMHLRAIDKVFGKGSLRVLAAMGSGVKNYPPEETDGAILRYFSSDDEKERRKIVQDTLIERERFKLIR
jgi:hypothetical protein